MSRGRFLAVSGDEAARMAESGDTEGLTQIQSLDGLPADFARMLEGTPDMIETRLETLERLLRSAADSTNETAGDIARAVLEQRKYATPQESTLARAFAQFLAWLGTTWERITAALGGPTQTGLIALAIVAAVGLAAFTLLARRRSAMVDRDLTLERLIEEGGDPTEIERLATTAAESGDYSSAVRYLFLAGLLRLDLTGRIRFRPGLTTGAIVEELTDPAFDSLARTFEDVAYGGRDADQENYSQAMAGWDELLMDRAQS